MASTSFLPTNSSFIQPLGSVGEGLKFDRLPTVVFSDILTYFTFEELAPLRQVNHFFRRSVEKRLNDNFSRLGRELGDLSHVLKRRLPRKESQRKDHPFHRYSEIISAMETRYTLLSMTYKKYMDARLSCFVPGKVLDLSFDVVNTIREYVRREVYVQLNSISVMRDVRDYSTMASEHFESEVVPFLNKRLQDPVFIRHSLDNGHFYSPLIRNTSSFISNIYNIAPIPSPAEYGSSYVSPTQASLNKFSEQLDAQGKQMEDMRKLVKAQNETIVQISDVLTEVTKFISPHQSSKFSAMVHKMNISSATLQEMLYPASSSSTPDTSTSSSFASQEFDWSLEQNTHCSETTTSSNGNVLPSILKFPKCSSSSTSNKRLVSILKTPTTRYVLRNRAVSFRLPSPPIRSRKRQSVPKKKLKSRAKFSY